MKDEPHRKYPGQLTRWEKDQLRVIINRPGCIDPLKTLVWGFIGGRRRLVRFFSNNHWEAPPIRIARKL